SCSLAQLCREMAKMMGVLRARWYFTTLLVRKSCRPRWYASCIIVQRSSPPHDWTELMKHRSLKMSPFLFASTFLLFAPPLLAIQIGEECSNDADCSDGGICQKDMWTNGCAAPSEDGAEKCDTTVHESETGFCYIPPEQCESDAECGEYLSCIEESSGSCTGSSDGETICTETKGPSYCGAASVVCESDADCPRSFECGEAQVICIAMDCPDGEPDCRQCDNEGRKECRPQ